MKRCVGVNENIISGEQDGVCDVIKDHFDVFFETTSFVKVINNDKHHLLLWFKFGVYDFNLILWSWVPRLPRKIQ